MIILLIIIIIIIVLFAMGSDSSIKTDWNYQEPTIEPPKELSDRKKRRLMTLINRKKRREGRRKYG